MNSEELRRAWPTLSPRERDAKVAEALGWEWLTDNRDLPILAPPGSRAEFGERVPWYESARLHAHPPIGWVLAGQLLEQLSEGWWMVTLKAYRDYWEASAMAECPKRWEGGPCRWEPGAPGESEWCYYCERLRIDAITPEWVQTIDDCGPSAVAFLFCLTQAQEAFA